MSLSSVRQTVLFVLAAGLTGVLGAALGTDRSGRAWLICIGAALELWGVLLIASPELAPRARRLARGSADAARGAATRVRERIRIAIRRLLKRPLVVTVGMAAEVNAAGSVTASVTRAPIPGHASLEEKVAKLIERTDVMQRDIDAVRDAMNRLGSEHRQALDDLRCELEESTDRKLAVVRDDRIHLRLAGVGLVIAGLGVATAGNLL